jgi:hypothetical protein
MTDKIKYLLNTLDTAQPVYEVNYTKKTWRVVALEKFQYGDDFIHGKIRKATYFTGGMWREVSKPRPTPGLRVAA